VTRMAARMLHYKRRAFAFEHEVRLIWLTKETARAIFIDLLPGTISQIMTSPYASSQQHAEIKAFAKRMGIESLKSGILSAPPVSHG
jgi:hypothetical protein